MSKVQLLRCLVNQRLTAAAEEIFGVFERTIAEYEEELSRSKEENERQRKLLDAVFNPSSTTGERLYSTLYDVQQLLVVKEEVPPKQQDWSSSLDQEDPEPPHIKEDQEDPEPPHMEELWTSQEGEHLQGPEEADITKFSFIPVKSEDDEEKPQSSQLHQRQTEQMETEGDGEDCGGPEPDRNSDPDRHPEPDTDEETGDSSEPETDDSDDWKENREPQSGLNYLNNYELSVSDSRCSAGEKPISCPVCKKSFLRKRSLQIHMRIHTGEKPFSCSVCGKRFKIKASVTHHMASQHTRIHTGEKPFSCSVCGKKFKIKASVTHHMAAHTGEKQVSCGVCNQTFACRAQFKTHKCVGRQSSQLHQTQTEQMEQEGDREECGGPESDRNSEPDKHLEPENVDKSVDSSEPETDDSDDWNEIREPQSGLNSDK